MMKIADHLTQTRHPYVYPQRFTIIEILVVIAVISTIASMLLPAFAKSKSKALFARWQATQINMKADGSSVLYFPFDEIVETRIQNEALGDVLKTEEKVETFEGEINGPTWIANGGRWYGKPTLWFDQNVVQNVTVKGYKGIGGSNDRTVSVWIRTESANNQGICAWGTLAPTFNYFEFAINPAGQINVWTVAGFMVGNAKVNDNQWHHVAFVFGNDGTPDVEDIILYVDGKVDARKAGNPAPSALVPSPLNTDVKDPNALDFSIGFSLGFRFGGKIDEFTLYSEALSSSNIEAVYKMGLP